MAKINVFLVHSVEDEKFKDELLLHLSSQMEDGKASFWDRDLIMAGTEENLAVAEELEIADIIVLLLSADFFSSDYCRDIEGKAFALEKTKNLTVVPVMLRHFDLGAKYDFRTTIPDRKRPISGKQWNSEDEAFYKVAEIIGDIIDARIEGRRTTHLKPPSMIRKAGRKFKRPAGMLLYLFFLLISFSFLFLRKHNLPVEIKLIVNQVDFQLVEKMGNGLWSKSIFAKKAQIKNFTRAVIPGKNLRFLDKPDQLSPIPEARITLHRQSSSVEPYLYLFDVYLSAWHISDSSEIQLRTVSGNSLFITVDNGQSSGAFNFNDSLEFYTESSVLKLGNNDYNNDLEAVIYSSAGRVNFESNELNHSISLDSLKESINATNLHVTGLQFEKDLRNDEGTPLSSILSGVIRVNGFDPTSIDIPETVFLKLESPKPMKIQKIDVLEKGMALLIISDNMRDIQMGTALNNMKSEMPTILEWLTTEYELGLLAGLLAFLSPFLILIIHLFYKKSVSFNNRPSKISY